MNHSPSSSPPRACRRPTPPGPVRPLGGRCHCVPGLGGRGHRVLTPHVITQRLRRSRLGRRVGPAPAPAGHGRQSRRGIRGGRAHCGTHRRVLACAVEGGDRRRSSPGPPRGQERPRLRQHRRPVHDLGERTLTVVVATVGAVNEQKAVTALQSAIAAQPSLKGQHLARRTHGRRCPDRLGLLQGSGPRRAPGIALPDPPALLHLPWPAGRLDPAHRGRLRHRRDPRGHGTRHGGRAPVGFRPQPGHRPGSRARRRLQPSHGVALPRGIRPAGLHATPRWPPSGAPPGTPCCSVRSLSRPPWPPWPSSPSASCTRWESPAPSSSWPPEPSLCWSCRRCWRCGGNASWPRTPTGRHLRRPDQAQTTGRWYRVASGVMRRPAVWATAAVVVLVLLAAPFLHVSFTGGDASALPASSSAGTAYTLVQTKFADFSEAPAGLVVDAAQVTPARLASLRHGRRRGSPGRQGRLGLRARGRVTVGVECGPGIGPVVADRATHREGPPGAPRPRSDHRHRTDGLVLVPADEPPVPPPARARADRPRSASVMLFAMTRSFVLPVMALVMNTLTIGATFGVLVCRLPMGSPGPFLGFTAPGALQSTSLDHHPGCRVRAVDGLRRVPPGAHQGRA